MKGGLEVSLTNDRLLERSRAGDVDAFQELINQYEKRYILLLIGLWVIMRMPVIWPKRQC